MRMFVAIIVVVLFLPALLSAQVRPKQDSTMEELLNYSRPGNNHTLLGQLAGSWNFKDAKLAFVKGTLIRKPYMVVDFIPLRSQVENCRCRLPMGR